MTCKHCGQPSPEEFYKNAMKFGDGKLFSIFGRTAKEILRALHFYDMRTLADYQKPDWWPADVPRTIKIMGTDGTVKEFVIGMEKSKMTREEAIDKVRLKGTAVNPADLIDTLEALGLLKFENYDPVPVPVIEVDRESLTNIQKAFGLPHSDYSFFKYAHFRLKAKVDCCSIKLGKFTKIYMDNGSYIQGILKAIFQD